jgi:hypothetical protein
MSIEFELTYRVRDNGDGSASVLFYKEESEAQKSEEDDDQPFCESIGSLTLKVKDNKLFFRDFEEINGVYQYVWKPVKIKANTKRKEG